MKQVILYLTTKTNSWTLKAFWNLEHSMNQDADVYYVYHQQGGILPVSLQNIKHLFTFSSDILFELGYTPIEEGRLVPGSNHFPLLKFFKENSDYDYYWLVEDDVSFSGEWNIFFDSFLKNNADFLSSFIETREENPNWFWWSYLKTANDNVAKDKLLKSFNPICRLSHQALACIDEHLSNGWMGHHEVLLPTLLYNKGFSIEDFGGTGSFVKEGNEHMYYDETSMGVKPLLSDGKKNYLFHPVKEEKVRKEGPYKKNAVFVAAGKDSLHRQLLKGDADFDLHLLIYDGSYNLFCNDTDFICCQSGYKMDMTYHYIHRHPEFLEKYDYFFLMDDDIEMSTEEVNKLFRMMREYDLKIAQPSLVMSYYTYEHTLHNPHCVLRYTNFVEMMVPCFSSEALRKVLPTFEKKVRGCGIEYHWPTLINTNNSDMAILDEIHVSHIRPLQSWECQKEMEDYLAKYHIEPSIKMYTAILQRENYALLTVYNEEKNNLESKIHSLLRETTDGLEYNDLLALTALVLLFSIISEKRNYLDIATRALEIASFYRKRYSKKEQEKLELLVSLTESIKHLDTYKESSDKFYNSDLLRDFFFTKESTEKSVITIKNKIEECIRECYHFHLKYNINNKTFKHEDYQKN